MDPATIVTIVGWFAQPAATALFNVAQQILLQRLGLSSPAVAASHIKPLLDDYLQRLTARLDEDRIAKLYGAFSKLMDAPKSITRYGLLVEALDSFHEVAHIPKQGMTGGRPNAELRCMAFIGMAASYILLQDRPELIKEKMVEAIDADADTAKQWLGEDLVREIILQFPSLAPGITCPKCGFRNPPGARFCNQDGYPLTQREVPGVIVQTFDPVLYYPIKNVWQAGWSYYRRDTGSLIVRNNLLEFQGKKKRVLITHIKSISIECRRYIKVIYGDDAASSPAFFVDAGALGFRAYLGGTKLIADTLQRTYFS